MKNFLLLTFLCLFAASGAMAQAFTYAPNDSMQSSISPDAYADQVIYFFNPNLNALSLRYEATIQSFPSQWIVSLCSASSCNDLPDTVRTMAPILQRDTAFLHLTAIPQGVPGTMLVVVHVWDVAQPSNSLDVTFMVDATTNAIAAPALANRFSVSPTPANDVLVMRGIQGPLEKGIVKLYDLQGRVALSQPIGTLQSASLNVQDLEPGIYLLRYETKSGTFTQKTVISR